MYNMIIANLYIRPLRFHLLRHVFGYLQKVPLDLMYERDVDVNKERIEERSRKFI
jgi:hypothetical protein